MQGASFQQLHVQGSQQHSEHAGRSSRQRSRSKQSRHSKGKLGGELAFFIAQCVSGNEPGIRLLVRANLLQHSDLIPIVPTFNDLSTINASDADASDVNDLASRC